MEIFYYEDKESLNNWIDTYKKNKEIIPPKEEFHKV